MTNRNTRMSKISADLLRCSTIPPIRHSVEVGSMAQPTRSHHQHHGYWWRCCHRATARIARMAAVVPPSPGLVDIYGLFESSFGCVVISIDPIFEGCSIHCDRGCSSCTCGRHGWHSSWRLQYHKCLRYGTRTIQCAINDDDDSFSTRINFVSALAFTVSFSFSRHYVFPSVHRLLCCSLPSSALSLWCWKPS